MIKLIGEIFKWVRKGKYLWIFFFIVLFSILLGRHTFLDSEKSLRVYGLALQIFGAITIIISVQDKVFTYEGQNIWQHLMDYVKSFPLIKKKDKKKSEDFGGAIYGSSSVKGNVKKIPVHNFENILRYIDDELTSIRMEIQEKSEERKKEINKVKTDLNLIQKELKLEVKKLKEEVKSVTYSNVPLELLGIGCVIMGLIYATIPDVLLGT